METGTLVILGQPVTFCLPPHVPVPRKGRCPGSGKGRKPRAGAPAAKPKVAPKKTPGAKASPAKKAAVPDDRAAEVKKLTSKPDHFGFKLAVIVDKLKKIANVFGGKFDRDRMILRVASKNGEGELRMTPQGWTVNIKRANSAPYTRTFKSLDQAAAQIDTLRVRPGNG